MSFEDNGSGQALVKQQNDYYAFGLIMPGAYTPAIPNKQLYNAGSEWQDDFGGIIDYYSTFFREYDPVLGRFNAADPEAEDNDSWTVYNYGLNNPLYFNDPTGGKQQNDPIMDIIYQLYNSSYGGTWSSTGGMEKFGAAQKAFDAGVAIMDKFNLWGQEGMPANIAAAINNYYRISDKEWLLDNPIDPTKYASVIWENGVAEMAPMLDPIIVYKRSGFWDTEHLNDAFWKIVKEEAFKLRKEEHSRWYDDLPFGGVRQAHFAFSEGRIGEGIWHSSMAVSDIFLLKGLAVAGGKLAWKFGAKVMHRLAAKPGGTNFSSSK